MRNIDDYSKKYSAHGFEDYQVIYRRKKVLEEIQHFKPQSILEIGVGSDPIFQYVENAIFTIVEPAKDFYEYAKKISEGKVRCVHGFFEEIVDKLEKEYDLVICSSLLHEVEKPDRFLAAVREVCRKDTTVHINVPNANSMHRLLAKESRVINNVHNMSKRNVMLQQHNVFDAESLAKLVEESGFYIINQGSYFIKPFTHEQMYNILKAEIIDETLLGGLYNIEKYMPGLGSEIYVNCKLM